MQSARHCSTLLNRPSKLWGGPTTRWSRPGQLRPRLIQYYPRAGRAAHLEAVRQNCAAKVQEGTMEIRISDSTRGIEILQLMNELERTPGYTVYSELMSLHP